MTTVGLDPTTVENAGSYMAQTLGLRWPEDRVAVVSYINDYRDLLYNLYPDLGLFNNSFHCICISEFPQSCGPCNEGGSYQGFVLPDDIASLEAAWEYGFPLKIHSRWREAHFGLNNESAPRMSVTEMSEQTCTERAMRCVTGLKMFAESPDDHGKKVIIEAIMQDRTRKSLCFTLQSDGWAAVTQPVRYVSSVSLPPGRKGTVTLAQMDGYPLSHYAPHETVPVYRKFRIASTCRSGVILVQGVKRFVPVSFDHDVVEVGSRTVLRHAASLLRFQEGTTETKDLNRSRFDKTEMGDALLGLHARHRGKAIQDPSTSPGPIFRTSNILPGYAR